MAVRDRFEDMRNLVRKAEPIIVDAGAHVGSVTSVFLRQYPSATIWAFEPIPEFAQRLRERFSSTGNVHIVQKALGAQTTTVSFNVLNNQVSSSILKPGKWNYKYHGDKMNIAQTIEVEQVRLDEVLETDVIDIFKLDLQGYELEALKGAEKLLPNVRLITTEVEFVPLYEGQSLFGDIDCFLRSMGFCLLNLYELYTQPDGQLTAGDAVYLNKRHFDCSGSG